MNRSFQLRLCLFAAAVALLLAFQPVAITEAQSTAAAGSSELRAPGLTARVTVRRDERGIPYIEAANDRDLAFAQGYITAQDRLWQMDLLRRNSRGELSEIFGRVAFEEDKRRRVLGFAKLSEEVAAKLAGENRALAQAYADGVNAYIASRDEKTLPVEFRILKYQPRRWTPADSVVIGFLMAESLSTSWPTDLMRAALARLPESQRNELLTVYTDLDTPVVGSDRRQTRTSRPAPSSSTQRVALRVSDEALDLAARLEQMRAASLERIGLHAEALAASNNWVVAGRRTATGKPLLANDPHLSPSVPSIWYLVHLSAPGVRVAGVAIPGISGVIIGHNERIAWGLTNLGPDVQDLYRETFDPQNPRRYRTPAGWREAEVRREEIRVRKAPTDPETETITHEVTVTRHGPVVLEREGERYALRWTVYDTKPESISAFHHLNRARNWKEFTEAIRHFGGATQNFVYADVDGHIGYYGAGVIPVRRSGNGSIPYDGATDDGEWTGVIPFEKLPHVFDPPSGMIVTANARIVGRDYAHHLTHAWSAPYRQKRINDLLSAKKKITIDDFREVQGDVYAIGGSTFARAVVKLFGVGDQEPEMTASLKLLTAWDGRAAADSHAALLVHEWRSIFANRVIESAIGETLARQYRWTNRHVLIDRIVNEWPARWLPKNSADWKAFVRACHDEARASLVKRLGADRSQWTFGRGVEVKLNHPLASAPLVGSQFRIAPFPQQGNGYAGGLGPTVNVGPTVSMRLIADPSNWDRTQHGILLGASGDPQSPHYKDQLEDWRNVAPRVFPFTSEAVARAVVKTVTLVP